ncbi:MAG: hypothetical protein IKF17_05585 [Clostridia bacterium]|nr:hypothetical protein [Clostridia bacterium]
MSYYMFMFYLILLGVIAFILLVFIYKNDDLEKEIEEQQSLINASRRNLADAENRISQRNDLLEYQENKIKKLKNKLTILEAYITSNNYGNAELRLEKLKELVRDYQSQN